MKNTQYWNESIDQLRLARCHDANGKSYNFSYKTSVLAAGNLLSTPEDYCKFLIYVMNGAGLSQKCAEHQILPVFVFERAPVCALFINDVLLRVDIVQIPLEVVALKLRSDFLSARQISNVRVLQKDLHGCTVNIRKYEKPEKDLNSPILTIQKQEQYIGHVIVSLQPKKNMNIYNYGI